MTTVLRQRQFWEKCTGVEITHKRELCSAKTFGTTDEWCYVSDYDKCEIFCTGTESTLLRVICLKRRTTRQGRQCLGPEDNHDTGRIISPDPGKD